MSNALVKSEVLPQRLKPQFVGPETAGINACSTRWVPQLWLVRGLEYRSSKLGKSMIAGAI
jgi:hypothetical protein